MRRVLWTASRAYRGVVPPTRLPRARTRQDRGRRTVPGGPLRLGLLVGLVVLGGCGTTAAGPGETGEATGTPTVSEETAQSTAPATEPADGSPTEDLMTATPDEHSEVGSLAPGFPVDLLPVPDDAVILVTSAVPVGDTDVQELSLNLRTSLSVDDVVALYRAALTDAGFAEIDTPGTALAAEMSFQRSGGDELVSIGILDDGTIRTVTVGGRVRTDG